MNQYCYVIVNNAGHSWMALENGEPTPVPEGETPVSPALPRLLQAGWVPVRETPMGGGTSPLAHSLVLLHKPPKKPARGKGK